MVNQRETLFCGVLITPLTAYSGYVRNDDSQKLRLGAAPVQQQ